MLLTFLARVHFHRHFHRVGALLLCTYIILHVVQLACPHMECAHGLLLLPQVVGLDFAAEMLGDASSREQRNRIPGLEAYSTPME